MPGDKRSVNPEHNVTKRNKLELQGNQAKAIGKGFQDLPPEVIGKIMGYCSTDDKKEMRCVSKWYFNVVSTASKELKSLFETFTIKNVPVNYSQISEVLSNAIKRSFGPEIRLDLHLDTYPVSSGQIKILTSYKENIVSLKIYDPKILLQPHLEFTNIQRLDISFLYIDKKLHNICIWEAILARYGDKLEHLGVKNLEIPNSSVLQVPHLFKLTSLALGTEDNNIVNTFVDAVNKENITHLSLWWITLDIKQLDNLMFPKLQYLELVNLLTPSESALALIKCNKDSIKKLVLDHVNFTHSDIVDIKIPNLQYLDLFNISGDVALTLIKFNKDTITKLKLNMVNFRLSDIGDIKIPNLQYLKLRNIPVDVALSLMKCNKDTITKLKVVVIGDIKIPNLQYLELDYTSSDAALSFIKNNKDTITKLKLLHVKFTHSDIGDIKIPNLQYLELLRIPGDFALSLIKNNKDTLYEIRLDIYVFRNPSLPVVEIPRLKRLYLNYGNATSELQFIKAFGRNIEELRTCDKNGYSIRKSREELNNLKTEALALQ